MLEREVLRVADAERRRIGQDLHDGLGQQLTAIGLFLRGAAKTLAKEESAVLGDVERLVELVDGADRQALALARSVVPVELERNGLEVALVGMAARASALYGVEGEGAARGGPRLPPSGAAA